MICGKSFYSLFYSYSINFEIEQEQCMKEGDFHCNLPGQQDPGRNCCKGLRCQDHSPTFFPNTCVKDPFGNIYYVSIRKI